MSPYRATFNVQISQKNQSINPYFLPENKNRIISRIEKRTYSSPFFAILHEIITCVFPAFIAFLRDGKKHSSKTLLRYFRYFSIYAFMIASISFSLVCAYVSRLERTVGSFDESISTSLPLAEKASCKSCSKIGFTFLPTTQIDTLSPFLT